MNKNEILDRLAKLESENRELNKLKSQPANEEIGLPVVSQYDISAMVSVEDIIRHCESPDHLSNFSEGDVRSLLRLFSVKGVAQHKGKGKRGRGILLYNREQINRVIAALVNT